VWILTISSAHYFRAYSQLLILVHISKGTPGGEKKFRDVVSRQIESVNAISTVSTLVLLLMLSIPREKSLLVSIYKMRVAVSSTGLIV
jgi:hypothetical protein